MKNTTCLKQISSIKYKGRIFSVQLGKKYFSVYENDKKIASKFYDESVIINY